MVATGLNYEESRIISIVAPLVSIIGPLTVGILADKLAGKKGSQTGKYLRVLIAICMLGAAIFYALLLAVPTLQRWEARRPQVSFACDGDGAWIFQERCTDEKTCYHWKDEKAGTLSLTNCTYTCQKPSQFEKMYKPWLDGSPAPPTESASAEDYDEDYDGSSGRLRRNAEQEKTVFIEPPHICRKSEKSGETSMCHVYTEDSHLIDIDAKLHGAMNQENETHSAEWCRYPLDGFMCHIPTRQAEYMAEVKNITTTKCIPKVECEVHNPYDKNSVLADSQCVKVGGIVRYFGRIYVYILTNIRLLQMIGDAETTFWTYLIIRCIADSFPTAAIALLDAAIIIATRETSKGRGDYGRQLAWGSLGWAIFAPIVGAIGQTPETPYYLLSIVVSVVLMVVAAVVILMAK